MATRDLTNSRRPLSIKAILITIAVTLGVITILASLAGMGQLPEVFGFVGVVLLIQAGFYAIL